MNALSLDLRQRIVQAVDEGLSQSETARRFRVSRKSVGRLLRRRQESGTLEAKAKPRPGARRRVSAEQHAAVAAQMRSHPQQSMEEHARLWQQEWEQSLSATTWWRTLQRIQWSHKKRVCVPQSAMSKCARNGKSKLGKETHGVLCLWMRAVRTPA